MERLLVIIALGYILSACSSYPIKFEQKLDEPITFSVQKFVRPSLTVDQAVHDVKSRLEKQGLITDQYVERAVDERARFDFELMSKSTDDRSLILSANNWITSNDFRDFMYFYDWDNLRYEYIFGTFEKVIVSDEIYRLDGDFSIKYQECTNYTCPTHTAYFAPKLTITHDNSSTKSSITDVKYRMFAVRNTGDIEGITYIEPKHEKLIAKLHSFDKYTSGKAIDRVDIITGRLYQNIKNRYVVSNTHYQDPDFILQVDFEKAKSRMQRFFGASEYNPNISKFTVKDRQNFNGQTILRHTDIALYPDGNRTILQFSGNYDFVVDRFEGENVPFGEEAQKLAKKTEKANLLLAISI
ncbi:hypothetical protein A3765_10655 [Oleiphilus sp. HI0130]|nr:hypothetical protein A3765_10655 [Oleiphilus sp. HI0130]